MKLLAFAAVQTKAGEALGRDFDYHRIHENLKVNNAPYVDTRLMFSFRVSEALERCLACAADRVATRGGEPLWRACEDPASLFLSFVWPKGVITGGSRE